MGIWRDAVAHPYFLEDNDWFGERPDFSKGKVVLDSFQTEELEKPIIRFLTIDASV